MKNEQFMMYVNNSKKSFRCDCGCNVFTKTGEYRYRCNACRAKYQGEPEQKIKLLDERIEAWRNTLNDWSTEIDTSTMILEADGIITDLKAECAVLKTFKDKVYEAYTPNHHFNPSKLEALLIAHMYEEK